jgi:site-specific recombinase XerC
MPWAKEREEKHGASGVKQQLAAGRMLFDWLVTGQVVPMNPAAAVRGPKHVVKTGKTPVLAAAEWRKLLDSIPATTLRDLRDRALIATLTYSFARIAHHRRAQDEGRGSAPQGAGWTVRLHEKGGKEHAMPCHHSLADALRAYIDVAKIAKTVRVGCFVPRAATRPMSFLSADEPIRRLAHDPPANKGGRHRCPDRQSHVSGHRDYGLSRQWPRARARAGNGGA